METTQNTSHVETYELTGSVEILTAEQCLAEAAKVRETLATTIINCPKMRRHMQRELKAWQRLAEARS